VTTPAPEPADPSHPGWEDVRRAVITTTELAGVILGQLAAAPRRPDPAVLRSAQLIARSLDVHAGIARRQVWDETAIDLEVGRRLAAARHLQPVRTCRAG